MLLHVHRDLTDGLKLVDVANAFVSGSENHLCVFDNFDECQL